MVEDPRQVKSLDLVVRCLLERLLQAGGGQDGQVVLYGLHQLDVVNNLRQFALVIVN